MLETVTIFKFLGSVVSNEGSKPKILFRTAQTEEKRERERKKKKK